MITFSLIARSGVTTVPGSTLKFNGFGVGPAIDKQGNVMLVGGGGVAPNNRFGVYKIPAGSTQLQIVADNFTDQPGQPGVKFKDFLGSERNDIDGGNTAFIASYALGKEGVYANVGGVLSEIAKVGTEWSQFGDPWIDGNTVAIQGNRLTPAPASKQILLWNNGVKSLVNPGIGYAMPVNSQASISNGAAIFSRIKAGSYQLVIESDGNYEVLATGGQTLMPGLGVPFTNFNPFPVIDGQDAAFLGVGSKGFGLCKRINGGALQNVAASGDQVPGSGGNAFSILAQTALALANGKVLFVGSGQSGLIGVYHDIDGPLAVVFDNALNKTITVDGQPLIVGSFDLSTRSFAHTPQGYVFVFRVSFPTGGSAIIKATISGVAPPPPPVIHKAVIDGVAYTQTNGVWAPALPGFVCN